MAIFKETPHRPAPDSNKRYKATAETYQVCPACNRIMLFRKVVRDSVCYECLSDNFDTDIITYLKAVFPDSVLLPENQETNQVSSVGRGRDNGRGEYRPAEIRSVRTQRRGIRPES